MDGPFEAICYKVGPNLVKSVIVVCILDIPLCSQLGSELNSIELQQSNQSISPDHRQSDPADKHPFLPLMGNLSGIIAQSDISFRSWGTTETQYSSEWHMSSIGLTGGAMTVNALQSIYGIRDWDSQT